MDKKKYRYVGIYLILCIVSRIDAMVTAKKLYPAITKRLEKPSPGVRKKIEEFQQQKELERARQDLQKSEELGQIHLYDQSIKQEYILTKDLWDMSATLQELMNDLGQTAEKDAPSQVLNVNFSVDTIKSLFDLIKFYLETTNEERKDKLEERIKQIDFKTLISILLLANHLIIREDIFNEIVAGVSNKIMTLNGINQSCFIELQKMDKDLKKLILTNEVWNVFLQEMKIPISRYCFKQRFSSSISSPYIYTFPQNVAERLSLNVDGTLVLYMLSEAENKAIRYLYVLNLQNATISQVFTLIGPYPSWINRNIFVYLNRLEGENKFILHDCKKNNKIAKVINPPQDKTSMSLDILNLISSPDKEDKQKVVLLYSLYDWKNPEGEYGLAIYNHTTGKIDHRSLAIAGEEIRLLACSDDWAYILVFEKQMYGDSGYIVSLHQISIKEGDFSMIATRKQEAISAETKDRFFNCIVSPDCSKIVFTNYQDICIQSLNTFNDKWMNMVGTQQILSLAFSEDSQMLMVGYEDGTIAAFDSNSGVKIGELLYEKKQAFNRNCALSFSSDGNTFALSGDGFKEWPIKDHLLIWKLMPYWQSIRDKYLVFLDRWRNGLLLEKIVFSKLICDQSREEKKELKFSEEETQGFHQLDYEIQHMFADIGYVAQDQLSALPVQGVFITESSEGATVFQRARDLAIYYWRRLTGTQPSSPNVEKASAMKQLEKSMSDRNRYVNE